MIVLTENEKGFVAGGESESSTAGPLVKCAVGAAGVQLYFLELLAKHGIEYKNLPNDPEAGGLVAKKYFVMCEVVAAVIGCAGGALS